MNHAYTYNTYVQYIIYCTVQCMDQPQSPQGHLINYSLGLPKKKHIASLQHSPHTLNVHVWTILGHFLSVLTEWYLTCGFLLNENSPSYSSSSSLSDERSWVESRWTLSGVEGVRGASEWTWEGGGGGVLVRATLYVCCKYIYVIIAYLSVIVVTSSFLSFPATVRTETWWWQYDKILCNIHDKY